MEVADGLHEDPTACVNADLSLGCMKLLGAKWQVKLYDYLKSKLDIIVNEFKESGISDACNELVK